MTARFLAPRPTRGRLEVRGPQATAVLNGLLTNDVSTLAEGAGQWAAALTAKGRVIALLRVVRDDNHFFLETDGAALPGLLAMLRKYVNPRLATVTDVSTTSLAVGVHGAEAAAALAPRVACTTEAIEALAPMASHRGVMDGTAVRVVRSADCATPGFDVIGPTATIEALTATLAGAGWTPASAEALEAERILAGVPTWGIHMTEETIAQEAALDSLGAVAFAKGCYTGQEVVARIHFRGHVNRLLRRLRAASPLAVGAVVRDASGTEVGEVRSSVTTAEGSLAIAMVRREVVPGDAVQVIDISGEIHAVVEALH
jgi:folate-binding protein YgfZ